ncbi:unnamed protein product [Candida verbasci]|uniref:DUF2415 domain-containing protein n=1 Tax=Candida verbasci TaxID=1227364 RepID=A0A9W4U0K4_9ASCO|nr:unnamed protein product [Candida verbasci]
MTIEDSLSYSKHTRNKSSIDQGIKNLNLKKRKSSLYQNFNTTNIYNKCFQNYYNSYQYLKPQPCYVSNIKSNVYHWQLRDLIKFNNLSNDLYYTKNDCIMKYNLQSFNINSHLKLNYNPRCFNHFNDFIVTGGVLTSSSKLFSLNLSNLSNLSNSSTNNNNNDKRINKGLFSFFNGSNLHTVKVGEMINNDVTIYSNGQNQFNSYICNNDTFLYSLDISNNDIKMVNKLNCETNTCLNNVVKNPCQNLLIVTGDSSSIFFIDPNQNKVVNKINSHHESGFGVSYHSNGYLFSSVFQDGICQLYDLRNTKDVITEIKSTRQGHQSGAFRVCKFSPENDFNDLLIISEHVGRIHLIDLRNLSNVNKDHQVIVVPAALDQYGEFKANNKHEPIDIYGDFTSPLVYDYDYLTNVNPKLFKEFSYQFQQSPESSPPKLNTPNYSTTTANEDTTVLSSISPRASIDFDSQLNDIYMSHEPTNPSRSDSYMLNSNYVEDSYQQYSNHIHGEMELSGIEFCNPLNSSDSKIIIGCQDAGILMWDINTNSRRSFSSFEMI